MKQARPSAIYQLDKVSGNPLFEGFGLVDGPSVLGRKNVREDLSPGYRAAPDRPRWPQARLKDHWRPVQVTGRVGAWNDYPCISMRYPAFSRRAGEALRDLLEPNGELLPIVHGSGDAYDFYNITTVLDALNVANSECVWLDDVTAGEVEHFVFHEEQLAGPAIFRLRELPSEVFVTDEFVSRVDEAGLNGFQFTKVWPYQKKVNWRKVGRRHPIERKAAAILKKHTLVLFLGLQGNKPTPGEKKTIKRFEDELDCQLTVPDLKAPFFGWYEGSDVVEGEMRLFLSCPDVDRLVDKLRPWLNHLDWPARTYLIKRYGDMYDENAEEECVEFR